MNCNSDTHPAPPASLETEDDTTEKLAGEDITEESIEVEKPKKRVFIVSKVETNTNSDDNNSHQYPSAEQPLEASSDSCGQKTQTAEALLSSEATASSTEISEDNISEEPQNLGDDPSVAICTTTTTSTSTNAEKTNKVNGDSNANHTATASNISGPSNTSRPKPLDKNSSRALSTPVSTFDTGSIGSLPSALNSSVGRSDALKNRMEKDDPSLIETRSLPSTSQHQQHIETSHVQKIESSSVSGQCTNQNGTLGTAIQQQQPPPPPQQSDKQENAYNYDKCTQAQQVVPQQPQQTVYYQIPQIPSVVTLPVDSSQHDSTQNNYSPTQQQQPPQQQQQQQHHHQQQQQHIQQIQYKHQNEIEAGDQIIGMVGAMPIIKLQSGGMHYVKKKKGRFSLLQETPVMPNNGVPAGVSSRSQSPMPSRDTSAGIAAPQTFDGKSAPTVKKKGRFFVTNVKDPGSILPNLQIQVTTGAVVVNENDNSAVRLQQQQQQQFQQQQQQHQQVSPLQTQPVSIIHQNIQQSNVSQIPMQPVVIQPVTTMQQVYEISQQQQVQQNYTHFSVSAAQDNQQQFCQAPMQNNQNVASNNVQFSQIPVESYPQNQQQYVQNLPQVQHAIDPSVYTVSGPISVAPVAQIQHDYQQQYLHQQHIPFSTNGPPTSQSYNVPTPPPTPGGVTAQLNAPSPMHSRSSSLNSSLPIAPILKPPTSTNIDKQQQQPPHQLKTVSKKKKTVQGRSGKVPQTIGSNGTWSSVGLGKVFYLMEQMKTEVTEADQCIKSLQTDMKLLRDKNKDLEAKNRELDKKLRDEQVLREKVEMRNLDLRKKLRDAKGETAKAGKQNGKKAKEEKEGPRQDTESNSEKLRNGNVSCTVTSKSPEKMKLVTKKITPVNGSSPIRDTIASDANVGTGNSISHTSTAMLPSSPVPQKSKLSITNQKEKNESKNAPDTTTRPNLNRINGGGNEIEVRSRTSSAAAPPFIPPLRPPKNTPKPTGHKHSQSLHDFDPLKSTVPVISFPTPPSLEALPIKRCLTSDSMNPMSEMGNTFVSQDPFVVLGMAPSAIRATEGTIDQHPSPAPGKQTLVANGYHGLQHQQFMVVPRQEPIMFDQLTGGVQQQIVTNIGGQWANTYPHQHQGNSLQSQQFSGGPLQQQHMQQQIQQQLHQQQQQIQQQQLQQNQLHQQHLQQQHQTHQMNLNPANSFDPFSRTS